MARIRRIGMVAALLAVAASQAALGQAPQPVQTTPVAPPPAVAPANPPPPAPPPASIAQPAPPAATIQQSPPQAGAAPQASAEAARPTLIPESGDTSNVDEVTLPEKPVLVFAGTSTWEEGLKSLRASFAKIEAELARLGIKPAGRPLAVFTQTSDDTFRFDAMVPIPSTPDPAPSLAGEMRFGTTPSGKAYRFVHKGPYDEIDTTYETITTYLDVKDVVAKDAFIEEYVNDVSDPADAALEINIFVQPREKR